MSEAFDRIRALEKLAVYCHVPAILLVFFPDVRRVHLYRREAWTEKDVEKLRFEYLDAVVFQRKLTAKQKRRAEGLDPDGVVEGVDYGIKPDRLTRVVAVIPGYEQVAKDFEVLLAHAKRGKSKDFNYGYSADDDQVADLVCRAAAETPKYNHVERLNGIYKPETYSTPLYLVRDDGTTEIKNFVLTYDPFIEEGQFDPTYFPYTYCPVCHERADALQYLEDWYTWRPLGRAHDEFVVVLSPPQTPADGPRQCRECQKKAGKPGHIRPIPRNMVIRRPLKKDNTFVKNEKLYLRIRGLLGRPRDFPRIQGFRGSIVAPLKMYDRNAREWVDNVFDVGTRDMGEKKGIRFHPQPKRAKKATAKKKTTKAKKKSTKTKTTKKKTKKKPTKKKVAKAKTSKKVKKSKSKTKSTRVRK